MVDQKQLENLEYFNYLGSVITKDARYTCEIKSRIVLVETAFKKKKTLVTSKLDLNLRGKKTVKCYIWSTALYGAETWTLRRVDQKYIESVELWCWRRMEVGWTDHLKSEVLGAVMEEMNILHTIKTRNANWIGHVLHWNCFLNTLLKERWKEG
jgi:hypothetical protein